jgi:thiamine biosynthesis lipoprotein
MTRTLARRRFICISAAATGLAVIPIGRATEAEASLVTWRGMALGTVATMQIHHHHRSEAKRLIERSLAEVRRLERLFSLYQDGSALVELNRTGILVAPAANLVDLLEISQHYAELTDGAFDPTVQPLWTLYADHFFRPDADRNGPPPEAVRAALAGIGWRKLIIGRDRIVMPRGTAATLNGIAQGYVTDKIVDLLYAEGVGHSLIDIGETRTMGSHPNDRAWEVAIADPDQAGRIAAVLAVVDRAVATSGAYGFRFDPEGRFNHLFNPATGRCSDRYRSVTAVARTATAADALSTAFSFMSETQIRSLMVPAGIERVYIIDAAGNISELIA